MTVIRCVVLLGLVSACDVSTGWVAVTFNAGLSELFVDHTEQRAPWVAAAVGALDADVVCLQEVWDTRHADAIRDAAPHLPHVMVLEPAQDLVPGACDTESLSPLAQCVAAACSDPPEADCILGSCADAFDAQPGDCGVCLAANLGGTLAEIETACTSEAGRYQNDGSYGLMLLSALPFASAQHLELDASLNRRAVIHARFERGFDVFCTHLTALEAIPYPSDVGSWDEEQAGQADALVTYVDEQAPEGPVVLLGDLNIGPDEAPGRFQQFLDMGLAGSLENTCTFCDGNPLVAEQSSVTIDHVLTRNAPAERQRIFDDALTIGGAPSSLSDHYGVRATVELD